MIWSVVLILLLVAADQLTKVLVLGYIKPNGPITVIENFLQFVYVENRGAAFGFMQNKRWFFIVITVLLCAAILYLLFFYQKHTILSKTACILIVAGGIGNLIDRIKLSYVVDFISFSFYPPVFNFADCCVVVGVLIAILYILFSETKNGKQKESEGDHEQNDSNPDA